MSNQPDGAFLFWARDWLTDENVVLMSPAAKGVYVDLLCYCWLEGSIPACSEHLARIARVDAAAFAALWSEIAPRFSEHATRSDRLVNSRMERERVKSDERRKARSDKASKAAEARWGPRGHTSRTPRSTARGTATGNAPSIAQASPVALLENAHQSNPSTTPLPPEKRAAARGADRKQKPEPEQSREPERSRPRDNGESPIADLTNALLGTRYRGGIANGIARRSAVRAEAERLAQTGLDPGHVRALAHLADAKTNGDSGALLAHWLDGNGWREVLDEQASKGRQAQDLARGRSAADSGADDVLDGIYGSDPKPAASVLDGVLANARPVGASA